MEISHLPAWKMIKMKLLWKKCIFIDKFIKLFFRVISYSSFLSTVIKIFRELVNRFRVTRTRNYHPHWSRKYLKIFLPTANQDSSIYKIRFPLQF